MRTGLPYGIITDLSSKVRCLFCGISVPRSNKCIDEHSNGIKHNENMELMSEHGINIDDDHLHCKLCKATLDFDISISKHIETDQHANWIAAIEDLIDGEFINLDAYLSSDKDKEDVFCDACQCTLVCSLKSIQEHVIDYGHRANVVEKLKPLNGIFRVDNEDEVWCKICDVYIENTVQNVFDHLDDDEGHMDWFNSVEDAVTDHGVSIEDYLANEHENNAFCNMCNIAFPCNLQSIEDHIISETHLNCFS